MCRDLANLNDAITIFSLIREFRATEDTVGKDANLSYTKALETKDFRAASRPTYSFLKTFTGLEWAARSACVVTTSNANVNAITPVTGKIHHATGVLTVYRSR